MAVAVGAFPLDGGAIMHGICGATILLVMLWRQAMRLTHGTPPPPESEPRKLQYMSRGNHWAFYVVLIAMPIVGLSAVLTLAPILSAIHSWTIWLLLALIAAHFAGAVWQMFRRGSDTWRRVLRRDPAT